MGGIMKAEEVEKEIRLIKEMVEKTRFSTTGSGWYLIFWGSLVILAVAIMYLLNYLKMYQLIWVDWVVLMVLGVIVTVFMTRKYQRNSQVRSYAVENLGYLWSACGIAFFLVGFVLPLAGVYSYGVISILVSVIAGIAIFVSGGIYEWNFMKISGMIWWAAAIVMIFVQPEYRGLIFILATFFGYLLPGIIINRMYKKGGE